MTRKLSPLGDLESHNVAIYLKEPQELVGLYGFKKSYSTLGIFVDDPKSFIEAFSESHRHEPDSF